MTGANAIRPLIGSWQAVDAALRALSADREPEGAPTVYSSVNGPEFGGQGSYEPHA